LSAKSDHLDWHRSNVVEMRAKG